MRLIGITGGPACGKSAVTRMLAAKGAVTFSADAAARAVLVPGGTVMRRIVDTFGSEIASVSGALNRSLLGRRIFHDPEARERLDAIMHPPILRLLSAQIDSARLDLPPTTTLAVEAPLLFEANMQAWFDQIVAVITSEPIQVDRLCVRNHLSRTEALERIAGQWPPARKVKLADAIIVNDGSLEELQQATDRLWRSIRGGRQA